MKGRERWSLVLRDAHPRRTLKVGAAVFGVGVGDPRGRGRGRSSWALTLTGNLASQTRGEHCEITRQRQRPRGSPTPTPTRIAHAHAENGCADLERAAWMRISWVVVALAFGVIASGCSRRAPSVSSTEPPAPADTSELALAEWRRDAAKVEPRDVDHPDSVVRRAAARALARIGESSSEGDLVRLLADDDDETAAFAAYGLGWSCKGREPSRVAALVARAASLGAAGPPRVVAAIARALGRCASVDAEATLTAWLRPQSVRAAEAALGLADIVAQRALHEESWAALLVAAEGDPSNAPLPEALVAFGRREHSTVAAIASAQEPLEAHAREIATRRLAEAGEFRIFAVRALGRSGPGGEGALGGVLAGGEAFTPAERAEAARSLAKLGSPGQRVLGEVFAALAPESVTAPSLTSDAWGPFHTALATLAAPPPVATRAAIRTLSRLKAPAPDASGLLARRVIALRCTAAALLAEGDIDDPALVGCDPEPQGQAGELARLRVLGRRPIRTASRRALVRALVDSPHAATRAEALELIGAHREAVDGPDLLATALANPYPGTIAAAANALVHRADRDRSAEAKTFSTLDAALVAALSRDLPPDALETTEALIEAAGALRSRNARSRLELACHGPQPTLREAARKAIERLGEVGVACQPAIAASPDAPNEPRSSATKIITLDTDAGLLSLRVDPTLAPAAAARLLSLASSGFFDGISIHRVVPGFVVQFGDRAGDGTGGCGRAPLRCETSPAPFAPFSIGVALAGRDTGSSQFFVTLARTPHLDGAYAWVGSASGDWAAVAEGDHIRTARVVE